MGEFTQFAKSALIEFLAKFNIVLISSGLILMILFGLCATEFNNPITFNITECLWVIFSIMLIYESIIVFTGKITIFNTDFDTCYSAKSFGDFILYNIGMFVFYILTIGAWGLGENVIRHILDIFTINWSKIFSVLGIVLSISLVIFILVGIKLVLYIIHKRD